MKIFSIILFVIWPLCVNSRGESVGKDPTEEIDLSAETKLKIQTVKDDEAKRMLEDAFKRAKKEKQLRHEQEVYSNFTCAVNTIWIVLKFAWDTLEVDDFFKPEMFEPELPDNMTAPKLRQLSFSELESRDVVNSFYQWGAYIRANKDIQGSKARMIVEQLQKYNGRPSIDDVTDSDIDRFAFSLARNFVVACKYHEHLQSDIIRENTKLKSQNKKAHLFNTLRDMRVLDIWNFREEDLRYLNIMRHIFDLPQDLHAWFFQMDGKEQGVPFISADYCVNGFGTTPPGFRVQR